MHHLSRSTYPGAEGTLPVSSCNARLAAGLLPKLPEKPLCSQYLSKQGLGKAAIRCHLEINSEQERGHRCGRLLVNRLQASAPAQLHAAHPDGVVLHTCAVSRSAHSGCPQGRCRLSWCWLVRCRNSASVGVGKSTMWQNRDLLALRMGFYITGAGGKAVFLFLEMPCSLRQQTGPCSAMCFTRLLNCIYVCEHVSTTVHYIHYYSTTARILPLFSENTEQPGISPAALWELAARAIGSSPPHSGLWLIQPTAPTQPLPPLQTLTSIALVASSACSGYSWCVYSYPEAMFLTFIQSVKCLSS